jgi:hypothetical protein
VVAVFGTGQHQPHTFRACCTHLEVVDWIVTVVRASELFDAGTLLVLLCDVFGCVPLCLSVSVSVCDEIACLRLVEALISVALCQWTAACFLLLFVACGRLVQALM